MCSLSEHPYSHSYATMVLTGKLLEAALATVRQSIPLIDINHKPAGDICAAQVYDALATGKCQAIGRGSGVLRYIRVLIPGAFKVQLRGPREECWLNTQAAVLRFHGE